MISKGYLTAIAQTHTGWVFDEGVQISQKDVLTMDQSLGLLAISQAVDVAEPQGSAHMAIQILLDDMQVNLPMIAETADNNLSAASQCLMESIVNINEYLFDRSHSNKETVEQAISLCAIQFQPGGLCAISNRHLVIMLFHDGEIKTLGEKLPSTKFGISSTIKAQVVEQNVVKDDILLITTQTFLETIDKEFLRITLSRFGNNLAMALRQINTRASHKGQSSKPVVMLARIEKDLEKPVGWFNRLTKN